MTKAGMVRLYAMMAALALSVESYAQTVLVQGKVINLRNEPVAGATIKVEETNKQFSANVEECSGSVWKKEKNTPCLFHPQDTIQNWYLILTPIPSMKIL